jgi:PAS domain
MQALGLVWRDVDSISPDCNEFCAPRDEPSHCGAQLTFQNWREKHQNGGFVVGRDLPSRALAGVLRNLAIYEPVEGGTDFRLRVAGTGLVRRYGCDVTGLLLSQIYEPRAFETQLKCMAKVRDGQPFFADVRMSHGRRVELQYESLLLPALSTDLTQSWVMGGFFYHDWVR